MKYFVEKVQPIAFTFAFLAMLQSCVIYKKTTLTDAAELNDKRIKITTIDRSKHKVRWIEINEENIISLKKTSRVHVRTNDIDKIMIRNPQPLVISLESALNHEGTIYLRT